MPAPAPATNTARGAPRGAAALVLLLALLPALLPARADTGRDPPILALIIDDLGYHEHPDAEMTGLGVPLTFAVLPHTPFGARLAELAHARGHEIMLHLPMQATNGKALGPGGITLDMTETAFRHSLAQSLASVPHVRGVNNHMGSLITRHPGHMAWLAEALAERGLYFIDSRTTPRSVALQVTAEHGLPVLARDVFLDSAPPHDAEWVDRQLDAAVRLAERRGHAVVIGHPYPETLAVLRARLPELQARGIRFLRVSELLQHLNRRKATWQASSSPSPKVAKNSKPSPSSTCCAAPASKSSPPG